MKNQASKILAWLLVIVMLIGLLPFAVSATQEGLEAEQSQNEESQEEEARCRR